VLQGAFILAKAKGEAAIAGESIDHLPRYIRPLFNKTERISEMATDLVTYLSFDGHCEAAFKHYEKILGGKILMMVRYADAPADAGVPGRAVGLFARIAVSAKCCRDIMVRILLDGEGVTFEHHERFCKFCDSAVVVGNR